MLITGWLNLLYRANVRSRSQLPCRFAISATLMSSMNWLSRSLTRSSDARFRDSPAWAVRQRLAPLLMPSIDGESCPDPLAAGPCGDG